MNIATIDRVSTVPPMGFGASAGLRLVLAEDAHTSRSYVRPAAANETMADLAGEAQALETIGSIDRGALGTDWTLATNDDEIDEVELETSAIMDEGYAPDFEDVEDDRATMQ